jgi:hypothetical protein
MTPPTALVAGPAWNVVGVGERFLMAHGRLPTLPGLCVLVFSMLAAGLVAAEPSSQTFGIATEMVHVVVASEFDTLSSNDVWSYDTLPVADTGYVLRTSMDPVVWVAGVRLPAGAVVTRLELAGCDSSGTDALLFQLVRTNLPVQTGYDHLMTTGSTGAGATLGCGRFSTTPADSPPVIDNANASYWIFVQTAGGISFDSARVYYKLQVSPAPATATFGDVPASHPFFQFVEALVASGITAGCGGGNYCPDAPLTRGQMAVFLSKALGLHFAP